MEPARPLFPKHPNKEIEAVLVFARAKGWTIRKSKARAHAWGKMLCPYNDATCRCGRDCIKSISSTPRNPHTHATQLRRVVDGCIRRTQDEDL